MFLLEIMVCVHYVIGVEIFMLFPLSSRAYSQREGTLVEEHFDKAMDLGGCHYAVHYRTWRGR